MIWKMAHACDVHEVMTYEVRVQAQRSAIQPRKQQCELRFWDTPPTEMFLIPFFSLPWISLSCLIHPQLSMKNQPSLGPLHSPYFSIITCPPKHIEKQNPAGVWRMKGPERPPSGRGGEAWNPHNSINTYWKSESHSVMSDSLPPYGLYSPWNSTGQNTGVGNLSLLQGIFPTQGSNPGLPHCRQILYQLSHKRSPNIYCTVF